MFDDSYYRGLLEKAWEEEAFVFCTTEAKNQKIYFPSPSDIIIE